MRTISLWQPWASLYVGMFDRGELKPGPKRYETRHWPTTYRGWLLIHAAIKRVTAGELGGELIALATLRGFDRVPYGALLGAVYLDHCQHVDRVLVEFLAKEDPDSLVCGNFTPTGRFAWRRSEAVPLLEPIPWRGQQGFWDVPETELPGEFLERIARARP